MTIPRFTFTSSQLLKRHLQTRVKPINLSSLIQLRFEKPSTNPFPLFEQLRLGDSKPNMPPKGSTKRKRTGQGQVEVDLAAVPVHPSPPPNFILEQAEEMGRSKGTEASTNPDMNPEIMDARSALRASPDADEDQRPGEKATEEFDVGKVVAGGEQSVKEDAIDPNAKPKGKGRGKANGKTNGVDKVSAPGPEVKVADKAYEDGVVKRESTPLAPVDEDLEPPSKKAKKTPTKASIAAKKGADEIKAFKAAQIKVKKEDGTEAEGSVAGTAGGEDDGDGPDHVDDQDARQIAAKRSPPVNSDYLPLPWKGRLGYACLNTYLRFSNPPVFASRTCRIASILEHRYPLADPTQPEHPTKNRPDKTKPASVERGMQYVESIGLANAKDCVKMIRWNAKYGIRFMRLSSEMFPFASHDEYGYTLAPFAKEVLAEVGKVAAEEGCRLTTHPGQFTQLGSPRQQVIDNAVRDLEYHAELLSLLDMPDQLDRDAVMILHLGGVFGDKDATLQRFKDNYLKLSDGVKKRLVLENDDVSWSVHDLLPVCEELNIPMVLDFHHHNIIFDSTQLREGTRDIMDLYPRIKATWTKKGITQKMHYSEPCPEAITGRERRKHNPRPATLPPCADDMDLMIEAKDKEQAVFEMMRNFRLPGWDTFNNIVPYERDDDNKPEPKRAKKGKKKTKKQLQAEADDPSLIEEEEEVVKKEVVPEEEVGMGGKHNRVYWPPGMEEWLRPKKREVKKKGADAVDPVTGETDAQALAHPTPMNLKQRQAAKAKKASGGTTTDDGTDLTDATDATESKPTPVKPKRAPARAKKTKAPVKAEEEDEDEDALTPPEDEDDASSLNLSSGSEDEVKPAAKGKAKANGSRPTPSRRSTGRKAATKKVGSGYKEESSGSEMDVD